MGNQQLLSARNAGRIVSIMFLLSIVFPLSGCGKSAEQTAREDEADRQRMRQIAQAELDADARRFAAVARGAAPPKAATEDAATGEGAPQTAQVAATRHTEQAVKRRDDVVVRELTEAVKRSLKDPNSAQFRDIHVASHETKCGTAVEAICGQVNARNAFGGYVGFRPFLAYQSTCTDDPGTKTEMVGEISQDGLREIWDKMVVDSVTRMGCPTN